MKDQPLVSIVTPSLNAGKFIEDTILSVLNQDYPRIEHIIIDGGSTDDTLSILRRYDSKITWISEKDRGLSNAVNKGFRMAHGEIVTWLNADEGYFRRDTIRLVVRAFQTHPEADLIYGDSVFINAERYVLRVKAVWPRFNYRLLLLHNYISEPSVFYRRVIIDKYKLDEQLNWSMDYDFWLRVGQEHRFMYMNAIIATVGKHPRAKTVAHSDQHPLENILIRQRYGLSGNFARSRRLWAISWLIHQLLKIRGVTRLPEVWRNKECANRWNLDSRLSLFYRQISRIPARYYKDICE